MCKDIVEWARLKASIIAFIEYSRKYCFSRNAPTHINNALRRIFTLVLICNDIVKLDRLNKVASDIFHKFYNKNL